MEFIHCSHVIFLLEQMSFYHFPIRVQHVMHYHKRLPAKCYVSVSLFDRSCLSHCLKPSQLLPSVSLPLFVSHSEASASLTTISILLAMCDLDVLGVRQGLVCVCQCVCACVCADNSLDWKNIDIFTRIQIISSLPLCIKGFLQSTPWCVYGCV